MIAILLADNTLHAQSLPRQFRALRRVAFPARSPATETSGVAVADYDLDGAPDLVFCDFADTKQLYLYKNDGRGGFADVTATALPALPRTFAWKVAFLRADADVFPDILVTMAGRKLLLLNQGNGTFKDVSATNIPQTVISSTGIAVGDVDGDGDMDVVLTSAWTDNELWLNDGRGVFTDASVTNLPNARTLGSWDATFADVDGDKDLDVFFGNSNYKHQTLMINDGKGVFRFDTIGLPGPQTSTRRVAVGDVDGDGDVDAFFGNFAQQDRLMINDGKGLFRDETVARLPLGLTGTYGAEMADIDEDGDLDIVVANYTNPTMPTQPLTLLLNDGTGKFFDATSHRMPNVPLNSLCVAIADFDRDRDADIAFAGWLTDDGIYVNHEGQLTAGSAPKIGATWSLDVHAQPGYAKYKQSGVALLGSSQLVPRVSTPWGQLGISPPWFLIGPWTVLPSTNGTTTIPVQVPNDPALQNIDLWLQGVHDHAPTDVRLMNVWHETIR
ncbi:MAG: VCBS repeat-containing protein [Planctomycetes bacterium]|nr:VCBS repeat-containing protein [Planctomycetota bacterium]